MFCTYIKVKVKAKDLTFKANSKNSKFVFENISRPRTKDNNTGWFVHRVGIRCHTNNCKHIF